MKITLISAPKRFSDRAKFRKYSRHQRFRRLRTTADPTFREAVTPNRNSPPVVALKFRSIQFEGQCLRPCFLSSRNSKFRFSAESELFSTGFDDETLASLGAPAIQNFLTAFGGHPLTETVAGFTAAVRGLISPFHGFPLLSIRRSLTSKCLYIRGCLTLHHEIYGVRIKHADPRGSTLERSGPGC